MDRRKNRKMQIGRIAVLLIGCLMTTLLWGCSDGKDTVPKDGKDPASVATEDAAVPRESELLDTVDEVMAYVEEMAQAGAEEYTLVCSQELYDTLMKVTYKTDKAERKAIYSLLNNAGLYNCNVINAGIKKTITVTDISFYPGYEILRAVEQGKEAELNSTLRKTLAEAQTMAEACRTSDPLETAKNIQNTICERVRYAYMTNMSDVDTAVGTLLKNVADCDGYADAFYLVGGLAGLEVRCQHGIASNYDHEKNTIETSSHMWNLLKLEGSWRVVDVCWADGENGVEYTWFNIGKDRASRSRAWQEDLTVPLLEETDLSAKPENEYSVTTYEELEAAIKEAVDRDQTPFTVIFDRPEYISKKDAFDVLWNYYDSEASYYWDECTRALTILLEDE